MGFRERWSMGWNLLLVAGAAIALFATSPSRSWSRQETPQPSPEAQLGLPEIPALVRELQTAMGGIGIEGYGHNTVRERIEKAGLTEVVEGAEFLRQTEEYLLASRLDQRGGGGERVSRLLLTLSAARLTEAVPVLKRLIQNEHYWRHHGSLLRALATISPQEPFIRETLTRWVDEACAEGIRWAGRERLFLYTDIEFTVREGTRARTCPMDQVQRLDRSTEKSLDRRGSLSHYANTLGHVIGDAHRDAWLETMKIEEMIPRLVAHYAALETVKVDETRAVFTVRRMGLEEEFAKAARAFMKTRTEREYWDRLLEALDNLGIDWTEEDLAYGRLPARPNSGQPGQERTPPPRIQQ